MFNNRFNSTKKDPLVEAVQIAMQDGEIRRQAEALVNEEFGVFNRRAVVREQLAAYDARLEEAYKCMKEGEKKDEKKEYKPKADYSKMREKMVGKGKDLETTRKIVGEGNDGNLANNYPPYDKVTRGDVIAGATGKDQMGGKKKKMEETDYSAPDRAAVTRDNKPSTPAQTNAATSGPSAADKAALTSKISTMKEALKGNQHRIDANKNNKIDSQDFKLLRARKSMKEEQVDEAAYSAKAARAGKDIGKPGKEFKKIAKSAAARYGSEERGKKVAGAILARIRAKHMKEADVTNNYSGSKLSDTGHSGTYHGDVSYKSSAERMKSGKDYVDPHRTEIKNDKNYPGL